MNINLTLVVQIGNFLIVYGLLRFFLFKPTIKAIEEDKARKSAMLDSIDQQKKSIEIQEKERQRHWYTCQEYFLLHQPQMRKTTFSPLADRDHLSHVSKSSSDTITHIAQDIHAILKEKIKHVH